MVQRILPIHSPNYIPSEQLVEGFDLYRSFAVEQPLALEIGCGTGHFIVSRATQQPEMNFLAIDIYNRGCLKTCNKLDAEGIPNVRVLRVEARYLLYQALRPESLSAVYINCPDPWPKKRHRQRRLVNQDFLEILRHYLVPAAAFYFVTDFRDYALEVAGLFQQIDGYRNQLDRDYRHDLPGYPSSKYMERFRAAGEPLYYLLHQRDPDLSRRDLPCPDFERGFRTNWRRVENG